MATKEDSHDIALPPLIKAISANEVDGFDEAKSSTLQPPSTSVFVSKTSFNSNVLIDVLFRMFISGFLYNLRGSKQRAW